MDFTISEEQRAMKNLVRDYMKSEQTLAWMKEAHETQEYPRAFMRDVSTYGFLGMNIEEKYAGMNMSFLDALLVFEEFAYASIPFSLNILVQNSLFGFALQQFGTAAQKEKYLPRIAQGKLFGCFANTEPSAGTDAKNISTRAEPVKGKWVLNGEKHFCTSASVAGVAVVFARTSMRGAGHPGITAFLVELGPTAAGISVKNQSKNAQYGSVLCAITLDNVECAMEDILGRVETGWNVCERTFLHSRLWIAMQGVGAARRALDVTLDYTLQRNTFGKPIFDHQHISSELARIDTMIQAARLLTLHAAHQEMTDPAQPELAAMASRAKYLATEVAEMAALHYYRFSGGLSVTKEWSAAQHLLDSLVLPIYEGPNEIQLQIIANHLKRTVRFR